MTSRLSRLSACLLAAAMAAPATPGIKVEVFFDGDRGQGSGMIFDGKAGENTFVISLPELPEGAHLISFRTEDDMNRRSVTVSRTIFVFAARGADAAEYFIDSDPGAGSGTSISLKGGVSGTFTVPTGNLSVGTHTLTVRLLKNGSWTETMTRAFAVTPSSLLYEWFFDSDPGTGNASQIEASTGENIFMLPVLSLSPGAHLFSSRVRSKSGQWSGTVSRPVYVTEKIDGIVSAEYYVDSDPGKGSGNAIAFSDKGEAAFSIPTTSLTTGTHILTLRGQDASGKWLELFSAPFEVMLSGGLSNVGWKMQFDIHREGDALRLVTDDIESGSMISIVSLKGFILHQSVLTDTADSQLIPVNMGDAYVIVSIVTPSGQKSTKTVKL